MQVSDAIRSRRSIRRFSPRELDPAMLEQLAELGRLYASGGNRQPIRFAVLSAGEARQQLFATLKWAMYLPGFEIRPEQQPTGYILLLRDSRVSSGACGFDLGAAATTVMLAAREQGLDSCCLASFSREKVTELLGLSEALVPELVIALGYADQESRAVDMAEDYRYFETPDGVLNVPKLTPEAALVYSDAKGNGR